MRIPQLESDLRAKKQQLAGLLDKTMRAAADHVVTPATASTPAITGRLMTDDERGAIESLQAECRDIQGRIDRAQGDASMVAAIQQLTGEVATTRASVSGSASQDRRSLGQRFISDQNVRAFFAAGGHRRTQWTSPPIEGTHWAYERINATAITEDPASGGVLVQPDLLPGILGLPMRRPVVADLAAPGTTASNAVNYMKETAFTNAAAPVKEGLPKPESALTFASATAPVRKIAHWIPISEEMLEDAPAIASIIDARLRWGVEIKEEDQLLNGTGIDPQILGYNNLPGMAADVVKGTDTIMDAMLKQFVAIATAQLIMPDGWVMNPSDWLKVQITKNSQGNYLGTGPWSAPQTPMLWGISGVITPAQLAATALVGAFRSSSQVFRRSGITIEASNSHADYFIKNLIAIRAEERLALAVYREGAFGQVTGLAAVAE